MDVDRCLACGFEFGQPNPLCPVSRCADCAPEGGPGSHLLARFAFNLRQRREEAGVNQTELARRAQFERSRISLLEHCGREPGTGSALRIAAALEVPLGRLFEGIYWNPGEVASAPRKRRVRSVRLAGFFHVTPLPLEVDPYSPAPQQVKSRRQAARAFGERLRAARERRHLSQVELAGAVPFSRTGLSQLEHGHRETTVLVTMALARALEVMPEALFAGIEWPSPLSGNHRIPGAGRADAHRGRSGRNEEMNEATDFTLVAKEPQLAEQVGSAIARHRHAAGLTLEQLGEAIEAHRTHLHHLERGYQLPRIGTLLKTAAGLNLQPAVLTAGIRWDCEAGGFRVRKPAPEPSAALKAISDNARRARLRLGASQEDLASLAGNNRSDIAAFERGERNFRLSAAIRLVGALGIHFSEFFAGVVDWHVRPLPPPVIVERGVTEGPQTSSADRHRPLVELSR